MNTSDYEFQMEIKELISRKHEGGYWDFKKEWHGNNDDLLHDIICFSNNLENHDSYIIIGVDEENDYKIVDVEKDINRKNTQNIVDFLSSKKFSGDIRPSAYVKNIKNKNDIIDIIIIPNQRQTPFFLEEQYKKVRSSNIYTRVIDTNTPIDKNASNSDIEYLWKKRFSMHESPLERVMIYLQDTDNWINSPDESIAMEYYKYFPEFTIEDIASDDRDEYEFYLFMQTDSTPHWYDINIRHHQTILGSVGGVSLDGGLLFTASPESGSICFNGLYNPDDNISYKYFIIDSLEYIAYQFFLSKRLDSHEAQYANQEYIQCILVYKSELEKEEFEEYVKQQPHKFDEGFDKKVLYHFPEIKGSNMDFFKRQYQNSVILQRMLSEFKQIL